jgi:two-component system response regulator YesN
MIKVLIVDDNVSSRTDVKTMFDWEDHGYAIIGEVNNGSAAIQFMSSELPDLVITDMDMPVLNGIQLIEYIKNNCPQVKIIALSAYDDFDYVRQSMKNGAVDYVLKHQFDTTVLLHLLETIEEELRIERNRQVDENNQSSGKAVIHREFICSLLEGSIADREEITKRIYSLGLSVDLENLMVTVAEIDDFFLVEERCSPGELDIFLKIFLDISKGIMSDWENSLIVPITKGRFAMIFPLGNVNSRLYDYNRQFNILNRIRSEIKRYMNVTASFGVSKTNHTITELPHAYEEAKLMLENKFYKGKNGIYMESSTEKFEEGFFCLDIKDEKDIYSALRNLDYELVNLQIDKVFCKFTNLRLRSHSTRMICAELINIVNKVCKDNGIEVSRLYTMEDVPYDRMQKHETLQDIKNWIMDLCHKLITIMDASKVDKNLSKFTRNAVAFIQKNYNKDISLTDVAEVVGISSAYMSKLFKEECGVGFAQYLNYIRVYNAKWYIEHSEFKLSEVVSRVGFNNYNYFFKVFKKVEGITPLEFERICRSTGTA